MSTTEKPVNDFGDVDLSDVDRSRHDGNDVLGNSDGNGAIITDDDLLRAIVILEKDIGGHESSESKVDGVVDDAGFFDVDQLWVCQGEGNDV